MSVQKKQILFLSSWYPSLAHPTLGNFVQRHAEAVARYHNVQVLYVAGLSECKPRIRIEEHHSNGVRTMLVYYRKKGLWKHFLRAMAFRKGLLELEKKITKPFDIVHHNVFWPDGWQAVWASKRWKIPLIVTEHWTGYHANRSSERSVWVMLLTKWVARNAAFVSPVTQHLKKSIFNLGVVGNYSVVPNVVDTALFQVAEKPSTPLRFLHISSLVDQHKNITGILRVWKKLSDRHPQIHLQIGGDGPWEQWKEVADELQIKSSSISFFGTLTWAEVAEKMNTHHALVLFSNYENLPCVIVESMASGLAIISSDVGGIAEHISNERGFLVSAKNEEQLLDALERYIQKPGVFEPKKLRTYAEEHFSQEAIAMAFDRLYSEAIHLKGVK